MSSQLSIESQYYIDQFCIQKVTTTAQMSNESPLAFQGSETAETGEEPVAAPRQYGGLRVNTKARGRRRDKVKFFDSADWAMKGQGGEGPMQPVEGEQKNLSNFAPPANDATEDSNLFLLTADQNESPLAG